MTKSKSEIKKHALFIAAVALSGAMLYAPLKSLFGSNMRRDYHDLIPFIPAISAYLIYLARKSVFSKVVSSKRLKPQFTVRSPQFAVKRSCGDSTATNLLSIHGVSQKVMGIGILAIGALLCTIGYSGFFDLNTTDYASFITSAVLVFIYGAFIFSYGTKAFRAALFPLLFLIFMIPFPVFVMESAIEFLRKGSTECANFLIWISGAPYIRDGFVFHFPGFSAEVAPECSGIRSGLALFITALLAGHLFLKTWWKQLILVLCVIPMTMFKNGIRISTLSLLSYYVDPRILESPLHREGGIPFFIVALLLMAPILFFLRKSEKREVTGDKVTGDGLAAVAAGKGREDSDRPSKTVTGDR